MSVKALAQVGIKGWC